MREIQLDLCVIIISEEQVCNTQQACGKQSDLQRGVLTDGADVLLLLLHYFISIMIIIMIIRTTHSYLRGIVS